MHIGRDCGLWLAARRGGGSQQCAASRDGLAHGAIDRHVLLVYAKTTNIRLWCLPNVPASTFESLAGNMCGAKFEILDHSTMFISIGDVLYPSATFISIGDVLYLSATYQRLLVTYAACCNRARLHVMQPAHTALCCPFGRHVVH